MYMNVLSWTTGGLLLVAMACSGNKAASAAEGENASDSAASVAALAAAVKSDTLVFETVEYNDSTPYKVKVVDFSSDEEPAPYTIETVADKFEYKTLHAVGGPAAAVEFVNNWLTLDAAGMKTSELKTVGDVSKAYADLVADANVVDVYSVLEQRGTSEADDNEDMPEMPFASANEFSASITVMWQQKGVLTLWDSGYDYSAGAAHGMPWGTAKTFDLKNLRILQFDDIFVASAKKALLKMVVAELKKEYADAWDMANSSETIDFPGSEPSLVGEGVRFDYGAYEIGAYALGMPSVVLPYEKVKQYLTPEVKELLGMK